MTTQLILQEVPTNDCRILRFMDSSVYNPDIPVDNAILEVTPPGFKCAVFFNVDPGCLLVLDSSKLKITPAVSQDKLACLPDGIYKIRYSINPNHTVFVEYSFLRNVLQMQAFYKAIANLYDKRCKLTKRQFLERRAKLVEAKELIDVAKYKVDECGEEAVGIELYNEANRILEEINNCHSC